MLMMLHYKEKLYKDGFVVIPQILNRDLLFRLRVFAANKLSEDLERYKISAPISLTYHDPVIKDLICYQPSFDVLTDLGLKDIKYYSSVMLNSRPSEGVGGPHHDSFYWSLREGTQKEPSEIALMYYLVNTTRENGCLRVIPGTHQEPDFEWFHVDLNTIGHLFHPREIDVPVKAGDLVVLDARCFHARHGNKTPDDRTVLTMWYFNDFSDLTESLQAYITGAMGPDVSDYLPEHLIPNYTGNVERLKPDYKRY